MRQAAGLDVSKAGYTGWDEMDGFEESFERASRPSRRNGPPKKPVPWLRMLVMSALSVAGLVYLAQRGDDPAPSSEPASVPASVLIAPAPAWKPLPASPALFSLDRSFGAATVDARQHTSGMREDTLTLKRFGEARHARVVLVQGAAEKERSFFVDIARRAADAGLSVEKSGLSRMITTKFGPAETASVTLAGPTEQTCQAFRFSEPEAGFAFRGWLCGAPDDAQVACLIDAITLSGPADPATRAVFGRAERHRIEACATGARTAAAGGRAPQRP